MPPHKPQQPTQPKEIKKPTPSLSIKNASNLAFSDAISIKKTSQPKKVTADAKSELSSKPTDKFTPEVFSKKWKEYKNRLLNKGQSSLASIFENLPHINEAEITVTLENKALDDEFNSQKSELLDFLRYELNNYNIAISTTINKDAMVKKAYTPQEKFMKMSEKNPKLIALAKAFDAEVGYPLD